MHVRWKNWNNLAPFASLLLVTACSYSSGHSSASSGQTVRPDRPAAVEEIRPGILEGYLSASERPDSLALLPAPPQEGSAAFARDLAAAEATFALRGTERWDLAKQDAVLHFPEAVQAFSGTLEFQISDATTPYLYQLLRRTVADAGLSSYGAKDHYKRPRPFMANGQPIATPQDEEELRGDGSYPSGHTAIGWAWALILCELVPERRDALLQRGWDFGDSRMVCNVHWQSDVDAGRIMGAAAVACLHANAEFLADMAAARAEIQRIQAGL